ncbi:hypothetical protein GRI89_06750 [Altererythrobacter salegens]|uniref:Uncharacterized protein n=1 Tax=Croceibacterium salegens TaxID=1737568 RepID=A0A6I4SWQ7_9SPHN|nr:hypothetical protein [Croceibacterium salegens]MXO59236.1 hypothetical protein [Croceibacterium salegens]
MRAQRRGGELADLDLDHADVIETSLGGDTGNLALVKESTAGLDEANASRSLPDARDAKAAALEVYDPMHMAYDFETASRGLARIRGKLIALSGD